MRNSFTMMEGPKPEAVRACIDGGVSKQEDRKVRHKVGSAYVIRASERIEEAADKMEWKITVEVAKVLPDDATITQAETTAAVDAVTAICCLVHTGQIIFDLDVNLIEEWDKNTTRTKNRMKGNTEERERRKRKLDDEDYVSATDCARPKWTAQPAPIQPCPNCACSGSKKKMEELHEMMKKRHAMEYAKLLKECEEVKQRDPESENETNEQVEEKDHEWKIKFEEILTVVNEMSRAQQEKEEEAKASTGDCHRMVQEACHPNDLEKMLKNYIEAATEELSRKKMEFSEVREKNERPENQRNKKRSEEFQRETLRRSKRRKTRKTMT